MFNPFVLEKEEYKREIAPLAQYVQQASFYLSKSTGKSVQECREYIKHEITNGKFKFEDPVIHHTERVDYEDRIETSDTVLNYINKSLKNKELIAPTLTTYVNPDEKESLLVEFIDDNVKQRSAAKKKMFGADAALAKSNRMIEAAKAAGEQDALLQHLKEAQEHAKTSIIQNKVQVNKKTSNNSLSGGHVSASTPLSNKTAHSTLTSTCRTTSGYGNANNEKFVAGNRHYFNYDVVLNNIVSITSNTDYELLDNAMRQFKLRAPTVFETMECIRRSAQLYWREEHLYKKLENLVKTLNPLERAAFVYTGDFYHLRKYNENAIREFLTKLSSKVTTCHPDPLSVLKNTREDIHHLASQLCGSDMKGVAIKDAFDVKRDEDDNVVLGPDNKPILVDPKRAGMMASTIENVDNTLREYGLLIRAFWMSKNVPASLAHFPDSIRRSVLVSDTDSTIFTVQDWIEWFFGDIIFNDQTIGMCACVVFLASQTITHVLAIMSANLGIKTERIHQIAMKNEFRFDVLVPTSIGKHYYAVQGCREGNVLAKYKKEIKGVHLKSSNAPKGIMDTAESLMIDGIIGEIIKGNKLSLDKILTDIGDLERGVISSIKSGSYEYLRLAQIKEAESYQKDETQSPYQHYTLWNEVFAPKYGDCPPPPYAAIKVSTLLDSRKRMEDWVNSIEDKELADRMRNWLEKNGKKNGISTFQLPDQILSSKGIPDEIFQALDIRRIIHDATGVFYLILETLGVHLLDKKKTKLVYDYY